MPCGAVFLSYASQDAEAARRLCESLRAAGVEIWFDQSELRGGDAWDQKIRKQIKECALFVPIISANTQARGEGYFRLEWKLAADRSHLMARDQAFIVPVAVDHTSDAHARVPDEFLAVQWMRLLQGEATPEFVGNVRRLLQKPRGSPGGESERSIEPPTGERDIRGAPESERPTRSGPTPGKFRWFVAVALVGVVGVGFVIWKMRPLGSGTPPAAPHPTAARVANPPTPLADKSIAVLPLTNLSPEKENEFFADGIHEDVLTSLENIAELRVVSRTSVLEYRITTKKIPEIGRELGVAYVLTGSVRRAGNEVKITAHLVRAAGDEQIWSKSFQRALTPKNMFEIQETLAKEIAGALRAAISPETRKLLERRPTDNLAAYDLYLKARATFPLRANLTERLQLHQQIVDLDPNFAEAWGEVATLHGQHVLWDVDHSPQRIAQADAAIAQAVRLAPDAPEVMRAIGMYAYFVHRDYARAIAQFEKVIRLQPNNARAVYFIGGIQRRQGRWLESMDTMRQAIALDPQNKSQPRQLAGSLELGRRWDELRAWYDQQIAATPDNATLQFERALTDFLARGVINAADQTGNESGTSPALLPPTALVRSSDSSRYWAMAKGDLTEWKRLEALEPDDQPAEKWRRAIAVARVLAAEGDGAGARARIGRLPAELRALLEVDRNNARRVGELALMEAFRGSPEEAVRLARKAVQLLPENLDALDGPKHGRVLAEVYGLTGDKDSALREYARLLRVPGASLNVHEMRRFPEFAPLRGDPRFEALLNNPKNNAPLF